MIGIRSKYESINKLLWIFGFDKPTNQLGSSSAPKDELEDTEFMAAGILRHDHKKALDAKNTNRI
jgi:hypothetical protein